MGEKEQLKDLFSKYSLGKLTSEELKKLEHLLLKYPIEKKWDWTNTAHKEAMKQRIRAAIEAKQRNQKPAKRKLWYYSIAAAAAVLLFFISFLYVKNYSADQAVRIELAQSKTYNSDQVLMTLPNGQQLTLGESVQMTAMQQELQETAGAFVQQDVVVVQVPDQKQFNLTLEDGSKVWLNAGATLTFPSSFDKMPSRTVSLEGEGYFEVAHNPSKPFNIDALGTEIQVLGTKFNVQAFKDNNLVKTSLVEGAVNFSMNGNTHRLQPGEETLADLKSKNIITKKFDGDALLAWREGYFVFDNMELADVMQTVARWYNITVISDQSIKNKKIGGSFPNNVPLADFLADLALLSGVDFDVKGKEVTIVN